MSAPKFVYVQPSLREYVQSEYPKLRHFTSSRYRKNETLVIVADSKTNYVDPKGVLYVHPAMFGRVQKLMFDFFGECYRGIRVENAAESLILQLTRK